MMLCFRPRAFLSTSVTPLNHSSYLRVDSATLLVFFSQPCEYGLRMILPLVLLAETLRGGVTGDSVALVAEPAVFSEELARTRLIPRNSASACDSRGGDD